MIKIGPYTEYEIPAALQLTFTDSAGTGINLTGFTVKFGYDIVNPDPAVDTAVERTGALVTPASGIVKYQWVEADMVAGSYRGQMWAYDGTNQYASEIVAWIVQTSPKVPGGLTA